MAAGQAQEMAIETGNFGFRKQRNCTIQLAKTKVLISFAVTAKLICTFVFAYALCLFSHDEAQLFVICTIFVFKHRHHFKTKWVDLGGTCFPYTVASRCIS